MQLSSLSFSRSIPQHLLQNSAPLHFGSTLPHTIKTVKDLLNQYQQGTRDFSVFLPSGANLNDQCLDGIILKYASLKEVYLNRAFLIGATLDGAYLNKAYLNEAHLERASLKQTFLNGAYLQGTHLNGADLDGTHFEKNDISGADFTGAKNFKPAEQLVGCYYEASLKPAGIDPNTLSLETNRIQGKNYITIKGPKETVTPV